MSFELADFSEFQGVVHPNGQQAVILRAHNGWRADYDFAANRAAAHAAGCQAVGLYQYLPASVDAAAAAKALLTLIGTLEANEWLICDLEEGNGDEQPRWQAWDGVVIAATKRAPWLYSGAAFAQAHNLHPDWVAAYQNNEPLAPHKMWQNTDTYPWPWGKSDGSVFDGTLPEFLAATGITAGVSAAEIKTATQPAATAATTDGGNMLAWDPVTGGTWGLRPDGSIYADGGAPYLGGLNNHPEWHAGAGTANGQAVGIAPFGKGGEGGYEIMTDPGKGPKPDRYQFPRDGKYAKGS